MWDVKNLDFSVTQENNARDVTQVRSLDSDNRKLSYWRKVFMFNICPKGIAMLYCIQNTLVIDNLYIVEEYFIW